MCNTYVTNNILSTLIKRLNYFGDHSSLHGIKYLLNTGRAQYIRRSLWLIFVCLSAFGMLYILSQGTELFENDAISFVPETTYLHWDTDFPAITVCEALDFDKLNDYYKENNIPVELTTFYKEIIFVDPNHYCRSCSRCKEFKCPEDIITIVSQYRSPCNETIMRCSWNDHEFNCCERFASIHTEYGECFVFNSAHNDGKKIHLSNKLTGPGFLKFSAMESIKIDVHSPDDLMFSNFDKPIINGLEGNLPFASSFRLRFKVEETSNENSVRHLPAKTRKCLFPNERVHPGALLYSRYSYSTCILQCRAEKQLATCNCTHHMLPRMNNEPICDIAGLVCLTNMAEEHTEEDDIDFDCGCLPSCEEPDYKTVLLKNTPNKGKLTNELIERGTLISIYMEFLPSTRIQRLVVRSSLDYVGGTAGIFFGASILSVLEIIYLIFVRKYY